MGYSAEHKSKTRARIVESAGRLFRRYGYNGVGIDDIMAAAKLTRGGFYAHFKSKQDLLAATLASELELSRHLRTGSEAPAERVASRAQALIEFYLGPGDRRQVASRCPLVSLSADVARVGGEASTAYATTLASLVDEIARCIAGAPDEARSRATAALALCVGGMVLAHALDDEPLAGALLAICRERALDEVEAPRGSQRGAGSQ
jgi:TetR/AcrR family transcriptional regulator, transcriptional repressor for nem operon